VDQFELLPGSADAIHCLNDAGCHVAIVTNQSCIEKGLLSDDGLAKIHAKMLSLLKEHNAFVDDIYVATSRSRYKPAPAMPLEVLESRQSSPEDAVMIGDSWTDLEAAATAGIRAILVTSSHHGTAARARLQQAELPACASEVVVYADLRAAVRAELGDCDS